MREDVLIILNEREPLKQQKASELHERLTSLGYCTERMKPCAEIARVIQERIPKVLVLDYLLGDFGTALDVLQALHKHGIREQVDALLWTDEPSVNVAVSAMKLGARDYIETDAPRSVDKVMAAIEEIIGEQRRFSSPGLRQKPKAIEQLIYQAPSSRPCLALAHAAARSNSGVVVLLGPLGSGRSALARYLHRQRVRPGSIFEIEYDTWPGQLYEIFGDRSRRSVVPLLSHGASVVLDHAEFDTGELLDVGAAKIKNLLSLRESNGQMPLLIIGTTAKETALSWVRLSDASLIEIPPLAERSADFLPLLQRFLGELPASAKLHELELSPELIASLSAMDWPGNIRQLRFVVGEALATPLPLLGPEQDNAGDGTAEQRRKKLQPMLLQAICTAKERWERYQPIQGYVPPALKVRSALDAAGGNLRVAAVRLGTGVAQLKKALEGQYE